MLNQKDNFLTDFIIQGISTIRDCEILNKFNSIEYGEIVDVSKPFTGYEYNQHQKEFLNYVSTYIQDEYMSTFRPATLVSINLWNGVDDKSLDWHIDNKRGQDCCFLYYLDTVQVGGELEFKSQNEHVSIQPVAGTLVWLSQSDKYRHRAKRSEKTRRVINVEFKY